MPSRKRKCSRCLLNRQDKFFASERARVCDSCKRRSRRASSKNLKLQKNYQITGAEYAALLAAQGGGCAICGGKRVVYDVDHDHKKEVNGVAVRASVRGLLCRRCNRRLLPAALDSVEILYQAIGYLNNPPAERVLR